MIIFYCECGGKGESKSIDKVCKCNKCGKYFGSNKKISDQINMRTTWSGQTKVEFSQTTMDKDIAERNAR